MTLGPAVPSIGPGPLLLRLPNWLGDLVLALPVVEAAARAKQDGLLLVGPAAFEPLLTPRLPRARYVAWSRAARYAPVGALRRARPAAALLLTESLSSAVLARLSGAPVRVGFAGEGRGLLLTHRVPRPAPARSTPRTEEYRFLGRAVGLPVGDGAPRLAATPTEREAAARALTAIPGDAGRLYAVMAPGATFGPAKRWPAAGFAAVARAWRIRHGGPVLLVGTGEDAAAAREVAAGAAGAAVDLCGRTDLPSLVGLLAGAAAVVSNDSGVMHLAAALGRPTVAVFGSTSPVWTSASAPWVRNLYAAYPCSPCFRRTCDIGYGCLRAVDEGEVTRALEAVVSEGRGGGGRSVSAGR